MERKSQYRSYLFLIVVVTIVIVFLLTLAMFFHTNMIVEGMYITDLCNFLITVMTLFVLFQYAKDTNLMAAETQRMAKIQDDAQFYLSLEVGVYTRFLPIDGGYFEFKLHLSNPTKYPVTATLHIDMYWFNQLVEPIDLYSKDKSDTDFVFSVLPFATLQHDVTFYDERTSRVASEYSLKLSPMVWVKHISSPYYLKVSYKVKNAYQSADYSQYSMFYNLKFEKIGVLPISAEPNNKYSNILDEKPTQEQAMWIYEYLKYANQPTWQPEWGIR